MKATFLPDELTPTSPEQAALALRDAFRAITGHEPTAQQLAVLVAHSALETGNWDYTHRNNWGNVRAFPSYTGYYTQFRCNEVEQGETIWYDPPDARCNFRAFLTAADGALDHIRFLTGPRYTKAWTYVLAGDARGFVVAIKVAGYFTALLEPYVRAVVRLYAKYLPVCAGVLANVSAAPAKLSNEDEAQLLRDMIQSCQLDLSQSWQDAWRKDRDAAVREKFS